MPSTYSANLALELIATGEQAGSWGINTNNNLGTLIEQAVSGYVTQAITDGADTTITIPNGATGVARNMFLELTGTLTAARNLVVPSNRKLYFIFNNTSGGYAVTVKVSGQTGISVPSGRKMLLVSNGTDVVEAHTYTAALSGGSLVLGTATGGSQGTGTVNATAYYVNGVALTAGTGTVTSVSGTGTASGLTLSGTVTTSGSLTLSGSVTSTDAAATINGFTIGYRALPRSTTSGTITTADVGKCVAVTAGITVPNSTFAAGDIVSIYNDSASPITITASVTTMRQAGTTNTGNRTLAARGLATVWFNSSVEAVISGAGLT